MQQTVGSGMFLQVMYRILLVKRVVNKVCLHEFFSSHLAGCFFCFVLFCFVPETAFVCKSVSKNVHIGHLGPGQLPLILLYIRQNPSSSYFASHAQYTQSRFFYGFHSSFVSFSAVYII